MNPQAAQNYFRTKVLTATPEQLQLMLYDGAIRFGEQAKIALQKKNYEQSFDLLSRMQKIVNELRFALRPDLMPELCEKLAALYTYAFKKLVDANLHHRIDALDEAITIIKYQRDSWVLLMDTLAKQKAAAQAATLDFPAPDARMERSISLKG